MKRHCICTWEPKSNSLGLIIQSVGGGLMGPRPLDIDLFAIHSMPQTEESGHNLKPKNLACESFSAVFSSENILFWFSNGICSAINTSLICNPRMRYELCFLIYHRDHRLPGTVDHKFHVKQYTSRFEHIVHAGISSCVVVVFFHSYHILSSYSAQCVHMHCKHIFLVYMHHNQHGGDVGFF